MEPPELDPKLDAIYKKLLKVRERESLTLKDSKYLRDTFIDFGGREKKFEFRHYQKQAVLHLFGMQRFVLGDDTGLGKTLCVIGALTYVWAKNPNQKVLVLTTKSAAPQWVDEFKRFTKGINAFLCRGTPKKRAQARKVFLNSVGPTVLVMGYRSAVQDFTHLQDWEDFIFVGDEITAVKNPRTQVAQVCRHLSRKAKRAWGLSATIIKNNLTEGYGIYQVIVPGLFSSMNHFMKHFCIVEYIRIPRSNRKIPQIVGHSDWHIEKFRKLIDPRFLGRSKHVVAPELPTLTIRKIKVGLHPEQVDKYLEALEGLLEVLTEDGMEEKEVSKLTAIIYCQEIVNHLGLIGHEGNSSKLETLVEMLTEGDLAGEKVIVFSRFRKMVDIAMPTLEKAGIKCTRVTGSENDLERRKAMVEFQTADSDINVIFITMAGGDAINLQAAKAIIFFDSPWSAGDLIQILGRMIRIGSDHDKVYAFHLITESDKIPKKMTVDGRVQQVLAKKMGLIEAVIGERVKGVKGGTLEHRLDSGINELFDLLRDDAKGRL